MMEREIIQAMLHNCNPHIACVLRSMVTTTDEMIFRGSKCLSQP